MLFTIPRLSERFHLEPCLCLPAEDWLIVHSGSPHEVQALCHLAQETAQLEDLKLPFVLVSLRLVALMRCIKHGLLLPNIIFCLLRHYNDQFLRAQQHYVL